MASRRIPYIVGNTRFRDHLYWPTPDRSVFNVVASEETYPFNVIPSFNWGQAFSLDQIMALMWRVNNWHISGSWGANVSAEWSGDHLVHTSDFVTTIDGTTSFEQWLSLGAARQLFAKRLPSGVRLTPPHYVGDTGAWGANSGLATTTCNVTTVVTDDTPDVGISPETRHDRGQIDIRFNEYDVRGRDCVVFDGLVGDPPTNSVFGPLIVLLGTMSWDHTNAFVAFKTPAGDGFEAAGTLTIQPGICPDIVVPLVVHSQYIVGTVPGTEVFNSGFANFFMTPYDFFGYKNRDGNEVYNTTSGAQINDPFI